MRPRRAESEELVLPTQRQLAPDYAPTSVSPTAAARTRAAREDNSPWLFALAPVSFALTLAVIVYLSQISC